jgi:hypothetical protein
MCGLLLLAAALLFFQLKVLGPWLERAHASYDIVEEYEGQTREVCGRILGV